MVAVPVKVVPSEAPSTEPPKIAGAVQVPNADPDDPQYLIIFHRDVGGPQLRDKHQLNNPRCWCDPLTVVPEDSRRGVFRDRFAAMRVLN